MKKKEIICEICGKHALVNWTRSINYCDDPQCVITMKRRKNKEAIERFNKNKLQQIQANTAEETKETVEPTELVKLTNEVEERKVSLTAYNEMRIGDIRDIARQLGSLRYQLIQLVEKERKVIEDASKDTFTLTHCFEFEELSKEDVWEKYLETKRKRTERRTSKYRYAILKAMLDAIAIKNPDKFVAQAVNGCKTTRDFAEYVKELENDPNFFAPRIEQGGKSFEKNGQQNM